MLMNLLFEHSISDFKKVVIIRELYIIVFENFEDLVLFPSISGKNPNPKWFFWAILNYLITLYDKNDKISKFIRKN